MDLVGGVRRPRAGRRHQADGRVDTALVAGHDAGSFALEGVEGGFLAWWIQRLTGGHSDSVICPPPRGAAGTLG